MPNSYQEETDKALGSINRSLEEKQVIERAKEMGLSYVDIANLRINPDLCDVVSAYDAKEGMIIPFFKVGKKLRIAVSDLEAGKTQEVITSLKNEKYLLNICLASKSGIIDALHMYDGCKIEEDEFSTEIDELNLTEYDKEIDVIIETLNKDIPNISSAKLLNMFLVGAIKTKASDIHIEPHKAGITVRYRIDGILQSIFEVPKEKTDDFIKQTKHQAKLKLNVVERPQDGRFFFTINDREIDVRVSALPTPFGEDIVLRILDSANKDITIERLGFSDIADDVLRDAIKRPYGMILATGPTGSGKTTSLYALLKTLARPESKVITIEDPIEYKLKGITQSQISEEKHYTFANGLRSILRQDPDVVMVGEIRDLETAQTAAQASLTGHKVLSTLHTNDAIGAIDRLINMGLERFMVAPAIDVVIAQRLARTCCDQCSIEKDLTMEETKLMQGIVDRLNTVLKEKISVPKKVKKVIGCDKCSHTGYLGRVGLYEVVKITDEIRDMILDKKSATDIKRLARENSYSIFEAGIIKVIEGVTTIEEVVRISKEEG